MQLNCFSYDVGHIGTPIVDRSTKNCSIPDIIPKNMEYIIRVQLRPLSAYLSAKHFSQSKHFDQVIINMASLKLVKNICTKDIS